MPEIEMTSSIFFLAGHKAKTAPITPTAEKVKAEARLVEQICAGNQEAFNELYKIFAPMVHGIILARVPPDDVADLVQEVFLSAYKNLHTLRDRNAVGAWLAMIARNHSAEFYRRVKPTEELSEAISSNNGHSQAEANEVLAAIRSLPETYRETLVLRLVEGLTGPEIAEQTGLTPDSVRVNLFRGMKLLREKLGLKEQ
jgi:RNA polymerase sigma-70 factor (ECF subfamily)